MNNCTELFQKVGIRRTPGNLFGFKGLNLVLINYVINCERYLTLLQLGNFSCNLPHNFVAPLRHKLNVSLPGVTCPEMRMPLKFFAAPTAAKSIDRFYFGQWRLQQKHC